VIKEVSSVTLCLPIMDAVYKVVIWGFPWLTPHTFVVQKSVYLREYIFELMKEGKWNQLERNVGL
jgi:hypothetical protein